MRKLTDKEFWEWVNEFKGDDVNIEEKEKFAEELEKLAHQYKREIKAYYAKEAKKKKTLE